jgi:hypothetical protein
MKRRISVLAGLILGVLATTAAHGQGQRRGYERPHQAFARPYGSPRGYAPAPRSRFYEQPSEPYEPPLAPSPYQARANSLGSRWAQQQDQARQGVSQGRILPLSRVVKSLERLRPGRVLDAGLETAPDGRATYRVRWAAAGGRRVDFIVDAETGAIIGRGAE